MRWGEKNKKKNKVKRHFELALSFCLFHTNRSTHIQYMLTQPPADLNSPFLPEFGGPGGLSVTDPAKKEQNKTCTKQRLDRSDNSSGLCIHFRDKNNYSKINLLLQINNFAKDFYCSNITQELTPKVPQITRLDVEVYQSSMSAVC